MALFCMCSGLVAHFSLRKLITQQVWLYLLGQVIMFGFRAVVLREDFAASGGIAAAVFLPWRHMWYLYALIFWQLTLPVLTFLRDRLHLAGALFGLAVAMAVSLAAGYVGLAVHPGTCLCLLPLLRLRCAVPPPDRHAGSAGHPFLGSAGGARPAAAGGYGVRSLQMMQYEGQLGESAKIFNDAAYGEGYALPDRALFLLVGIVTSVGLVAAVGGCRILAPLGRRTLPIYLLHFPILTFLIELGFYEPAREHPVPVIVAWVVLEATGCFCMLYSQPVNRLFNFLANLWYKPRKRFRKPKPVVCRPPVFFVELLTAQLPCDTI